jgi:hypothetical protein
MRPFRKKSWKLTHFSRQWLGTALRGCWTATGKYSKGVGKPLGNAQRLLKSLWAILKEHRKAAGKCPNTHCQPGGRIAQRLSAKTWQFPLISPELPHFYIY